MEQIQMKSARYTGELQIVKRIHPRASGLDHAKILIRQPGEWRRVRKNKVLILPVYYGQGLDKPRCDAGNPAHCRAEGSGIQTNFHLISTLLN